MRLNVGKPSGIAAGDDGRRREPFDPNTSEALATRPAGDRVEPGVVIETLERGYRLDGQVLRAARVVVSA